MYEFFALSELMDFSFDGYKLKKMLESKLDFKQKVSFGVIYPLLNRMEKEGLITLEQTSKNNLRASKKATITKKGRQKFLLLMKQPVAINQNSQLFYDLKVNSLHLVDNQVKEQVLQAYLEYLEDNLQHNDDWINHMMNNSEISSGDLEDAKNYYHLRKARYESSREIITKIEGQ